MENLQGVAAGRFATDSLPQPSFFFSVAAGAFFVPTELRLFLFRWGKVVFFLPLFSGLGTLLQAFLSLFDFFSKG